MWRKLTTASTLSLPSAFSYYRVIYLNIVAHVWLIGKSVKLRSALLTCASLYLYVCICRSLAANVNTTHVARAVIVVALVTTSSPGWQEPSSLDMSVKVRKTNVKPKLRTTTHMWRCSPSATTGKQIVP